MAMKTALIAAVTAFIEVQAPSQGPMNPEPIARTARNGQSAGAMVAASNAIRVYSDLVLVPALVTDRRGALVSGLPVSRFTVLEDAVPQAILSLTSDEVPASIGLILDCSGSMREHLALARRAASEILAAASPDDEAFLLTVASTPVPISEFIDDFRLLNQRVHGMTAGGDTALLDTVQMGLSRMQSAKNGRRALVIVSDGMDNHSRLTKKELLRLVDEADVQIFSIRTIRVHTGKVSPYESSEEAAGSSLLADLAERSGGLSFRARTSADAVAAASKIDRAIRDEYVLTYHPAGDHDGRWHRIQVRVDTSGLRVAARKGYYAR